MCDDLNKPQHLQPSLVDVLNKAINAVDQALAVLRSCPSSANPVFLDTPTFDATNKASRDLQISMHACQREVDRVQPLLREWPTPQQPAD